MLIMVHTCCAPCGTFVFERLREDGHGFKALFFNPNIQPYDEYRRRQTTLREYAREKGVDVAYEPYDPRVFWQAIGPERTKPARCERCYRLRLTRTAQRAQSEGCQAFTTTLLISPYQEHETIKTVGKEVARETGISFHYEDYRLGYRQSRTMAKEAGLYCQRYCGCSLSRGEGGGQ